MRRSFRQAMSLALILAGTAVPAFASNDHAGPTSPGARSAGPSVDARSCRPPSSPSSIDHAGPTHPGARTAGPSGASEPRPMPTLASDAHAAPTAPGARIIE